MIKMNRNALVIKVKQPFVDWCNKNDDSKERTVEQINEDPLVFLVPHDKDPKIKVIYVDCCFPDQIFNAMIKRHCDCHKKAYPKPTIKRFHQWFSVDHSYTVLDLDSSREFLNGESSLNYYFDHP